ncbi:MAG: hypothetical protein J0M07_07430 [Anaerolineae bacterium]|nr:hypothetical protein [Anaerolineae bacterium]
MNKTALRFLPLLWAALACNGTLTGITSVPVYVCPTPVVVAPPPLPTLVPIPGYPTLVPLPTALPPPTVTPYVLQAPAAFYLGDAVFTPAPQSARFRLAQVSVIYTPNGHTIALWKLEIKNLSVGAYDVFPAYQSYVSQLVDGTTGVWGASQAAAAEAGLAVTYEAVSLAPNETRQFTLAGFLPYGASPERVTLMLDPTTRSATGPHVPGSNALVWRTEVNPFCSGAIADPPVGMLPSP